MTIPLGYKFVFWATICFSLLKDVFDTSGIIDWIFVGVISIMFTIAVMALWNMSMVWVSRLRANQEGDT